MINKGIAAIMVKKHRHMRLSCLSKFHLLKLLGGLFLYYYYYILLHVVNVDYYQNQGHNDLKSYTITIIIVPVQIGHVK